VELCNPSDITQCAVCTGVNADALHAARCSGDQLESFCKKQLCIPKLANKCSHTNESNGTCLDCAACSQRNRGSTHCRSADEEAYCNLIVPPRKHGPSCRATLEHYCEASRQKGFFECVQCSGKYHRSVLAANCTSQETGAFCKIPYKIASPCLAAIANLCNTSASGAATSSCGTCTSCVTKAAQALYKTGITCPVDELSDFCDSGCPNGTFVWTNNTHDEEQTPHCVVPVTQKECTYRTHTESCILVNRYHTRHFGPVFAHAEKRQRGNTSSARPSERASGMGATGEGCTRRPGITGTRLRSAKPM
jgi:hypothetical protein